jgi:transcriptional regulator with XRE-family HTH domain
MPRVPSAAAALVGTRIAHFRARRGMTQDQLAVNADIDSSNIRSYESGRAMMNVRSLVRIATALDVPPGELIDELTPERFDTRSERAAG